MENFFWRWFWRLPSPFTQDDLRAGYVYDLALRQFEVSDTRVFDRPQAGRAFFEGLIRDHLDIGRPQQVVLVFDRRLTPWTPCKFSTKVLTRGVDPQVSCIAVLFTKAHGRVLAPGLALLDQRLPPDIAARSPLGQAWRRLDHALDDFVARQLIAA